MIESPATVPSPPPPGGSGRSAPSPEGEAFFAAVLAGLLLPAPGMVRPAAAAGGAPSPLGTADGIPPVVAGAGGALSPSVAATGPSDLLPTAGPLPSEGGWERSRGAIPGGAMPSAEELPGAGLPGRSTPLSPAPAGPLPLSGPKPQVVAGSLSPTAMAPPTSGDSDLAGRPAPLLRPSPAPAPAAERVDAFAGATSDFTPAGPSSRPAGEPPAGGEAALRWLAAVVRSAGERPAIRIAAATGGAVSRGGGAEDGAGAAAGRIVPSGPEGLARPLRLPGVSAAGDETAPDPASPASRAPRGEGSLETGPLPPRGPSAPTVPGSGNPPVEVAARDVPQPGAGPAPGGLLSDAEAFFAGEGRSGRFTGDRGLALTLPGEVATGGASQAVGGSPAGYGTGPTPPPVRSMPVAQLGMFVAQAAAREISHLVVRLEPAALGRVEITLRFKDDGRVAASFRAQQGDALQALRAEAPAFARLFAEQGIELAPGGLDFGMMQERDRPAGEGADPQPATATAGGTAPAGTAVASPAAARVGLVDLTV